MFVELFLNMGVKRRNLATSSVLHSVHDTGGFHPDKMLFPFWSVTRIWGEDNGK